MHERADEHQLLAHAVRVRGDEVAQRRGEAQPVRVRPDAAFTHVGGHLEDVRKVVEILNAREELVDVGVVGHVGGHALAGQRVGFHRLTCDADVALVEARHAHDSADERGFAGAVVADESENVARHDVERHIVHRPFRAERLHHMVDRKHRSGLLLFCRHARFLPYPRSVRGC